MTRPLTDWDGTYPLELTCLGLLGRMGYRSMKHARYMRDHFDHVRNSAGELPSEEAFQSRMDHWERYPKEMNALLRGNPRMFREGVTSLALVVEELTRIELPVAREIRSPQPSATESTKHNQKKREVEELERLRSMPRPRGDKRIMT